MDASSSKRPSKHKKKCRDGALDVRQNARGVEIEGAVAADEEVVGQR